MTTTWTSDAEPPELNLGLRDWVRVLRRAIPLLMLIGFGLIVLLLLRLIERPVFGAGRPWTPHVTRIVCRGALLILGIPFSTIGTPMKGPGAVVANHASWLDIFVLNARKRIYFVSKAEVADWPGIGFLAKVTGTVFIRRERREAAQHVAEFRDRLSLGHKLLFFPEGTSTDGQRVLPFKPTLFAAFFDPALRDTLSIQPVTVIYTAPDGADPRFYGWWGEMEFGGHLLRTLAAMQQGSVSVVYHKHIAVRDFADRKTLAATLEKTVRGALPL